MKKKILCMMCISFLLSFAGICQDDMSVNEAEKLAKLNAKLLLKNGVKKVMFVEFYGEYITSKETAPGPMESRWSGGPLYKRTQTVEIGGDYYESLTNELYEIIKKVFTDNGIEVLDKEVLLDNENYIALGLKEERKTRAYSGGITKKSVTTEGIKRSVSGMGMFTETLKIGAIVKINNMVPRIAMETDCQASLSVNFKFGMGKKNAPTLDFVNIKIQSDLDEVNAGQGKKSYVFKNSGDLFLTNKGLIGDTDFLKDKGEIDLEKYNKTMIEMAQKMATAYTILLKNEMNQ
ncbi:MAG: hypothetical protein CVU00_11805 [Bacteroidetes bacterium HGW-Bacteroidetes-17]|nr:MAG: hypothetical protein CVU00_11805 [Bacteroidetes bacterium HGW-Bacteroidetes-17]